MQFFHANTLTNREANNAMEFHAFNGIEILKLWLNC